MAAAVAGQEVVFNLAGQSGAVRSMEDPWTDLDVNCRGNLVLLEALRADNREAKLVFVGSRLAVRPAGDGSRSPRNSTPDPLLRPRDPQARGRAVPAPLRLAVRPALRDRARHQSVRTRPAARPDRLRHRESADSPGARRPDAADLRRRHAAARLHLRRRCRVGAARACRTSPASDGRVYNVGTGVGTPMVDMARGDHRASPAAGRIEHVAWPALAGADRDRRFRRRHLPHPRRARLGAARCRCGDGLRRTVAFYRAHVAS